VAEDGVGAHEVDPVVILILSQRRGADLEVGDVRLAHRCGLHALHHRLHDARREDV